jgi:hypothetical protein
LKKVFKFAGIAAIPAYVVFTLVSHLHKPSMGPFNNWLSSYGSPAKNPSGALYYTLGCILAAALLALFYIGMTRWHRGAEKKYVVCYICAEAGGLAAACSLVLASLIPIGTSGLHDTFRMINMIGMDFFLVFIAIAAFMNPFVSSFTGILGILAAAFSILTSSLLTNFYLGEWVFFALFMAFIAVITYNYDRFDGGNMKAAHAVRSSGKRQ